MYDFSIDVTLTGYYVMFRLPPEGYCEQGLPSPEATAGKAQHFVSGYGGQGPAHRQTLRRASLERRQEYGGRGPPLQDGRRLLKGAVSLGRNNVLVEVSAFIRSFTKPINYLELQQK